MSEEGIEIVEAKVAESIEQLRSDPLKAYQDDLVKQHQQLSAQLQQLQATGTQLVGQLNQVAGAIAATEKIMADQAK